MAEVLNVEARQPSGKRAARRMRKSGLVPAVLYGHGQEVVSMQVPADKIAALVRHGNRLVDLQGAVTETAFIRELQWDTFGQEIIHIDFTRISAEEAVEVTVALELRGEAPGVREGGIVEHPLHEVMVACRAGSIPEKLTVNINELKLDESITVGDIELPEGVKILLDNSTTIAVCHLPAAEEEEAAPGESAEPEVIGRKAEEGAAEENE